MPEERPRFTKLSTGEEITALAHYYRGEVTRSLAWRERLDRTTNWAVGSTAAFLGFGFAHPEITHALFAFGFAIVYILLYVESRRFRFYDAYEFRVRMLHQRFISQVLLGRIDAGVPSWREALAHDLLRPRYRMKRSAAIGRRLYANYIFLFGVLFVGWLLKIRMHPIPAHNWRSYIDHAAVGDIPGWIVLSGGCLFMIHLAALMVIGRRSRGEQVLLPGEETVLEPFEPS